MLALRYVARLLLKMHPGSRYLTGALEKLHAASWRPPLPRLPALSLADFPVGRTTPGGKHHPRTWSVSTTALKWFAWWNRGGRGGSGGQAGAVAWLCSVSGGTTWAEGRREPRGFPFPPGPRAEAADVGALGRQRSFNPRSGTHVSRAPPASQGSHARAALGAHWRGDPRGGRGRDRRHVGLSSTGA